MDFIQQIPEDFINFIIVFAFSFLIGLEQRVHHLKVERKWLFGTDRTFTLIGILGYILYVISPTDLVPYIAGGFALLILLSIAYYQRIKLSAHFGATTTIIALLTYSLTPLVYLNNRVLILSVFVSVLILTGVKRDLRLFVKKFDLSEFLTLSKFIIISGVVLPLLPKQSILPGYDFSLYKIWIAIIAISGISYLSYILKKFVFPQAGLMLTAILGGLYSSTATTIILAKKSKNGHHPYNIVAGIIIASSMMYIRLLILAFIFNTKIALKLSPYFIFLAVISALFALYFYKKNSEKNEKIALEKTDKNPLEFNTALIFGVLFAFFSVLTGYVFKHFGQSGINVLSLIVGVTDIDPFVLNLFQNGLQSLSVHQIFDAVLLATASNSILKMIYTFIFGAKPIKRLVAIGFISIFLLSILIVIFV